MQFIIELTKFEGLLWDLPADSVEFGTNYEVPVELISKINFNKLTQIRVKKPENLKVSVENGQELVTWEMPPDCKDAVAEYMLEYKLPSSDKPHKQQISGLDNKCFLSNLKPENVYYLRILAVDFAKNMMQSEFIEFTSEKQAPNPPSLLKYEAKNIVWDGVDESSEKFEVSYCKLENADGVTVQTCDKNERSLVLKNLEDGAEYLVSIRAENQLGIGFAKFIKFKN